MKKLLTLLAGLLLTAGLAHAQVQTNYWKLQSGVLSPSNSSWTVSTGGAGATSTFGFINATTTTATSTFAGDVYITGNLRVSGTFFAPVAISAASDIKPSTDLTYNLGSVTNKWAQLFVGTTTVDSTLTLGTTSQSTAKMEVNNQDPNRANGELRIISGSALGADYDIRIDSPNPDIELIESDQTTPAGKYEIAVQGDVLQLNGRSQVDDTFENQFQMLRNQIATSYVFQMFASTTSGTLDILRFKNVNSSSGATLGLAWYTATNFPTARISSSQGSGGTDNTLIFEVGRPNKTLLESMRINTYGFLGLGTSTPTTQFQVTATSTNATTTVTIGKAGQNKGSCLELYDGAGTVRYFSVTTNGNWATSTASCK